MPATYDFGVFHLDAPERLLLRDGRPVALPPKAFDLLLDLVEHAGRLREKKQLMEVLWPDTFVEEVNLAYTVSALRKALGDGREEPKFIETVPTKGYRFLGSVVRGEEPMAPGSGLQAPGASEGTAPARPSLGWRPPWRLAAFASVGLVLAATLAAYIVRAGPDGAAPAQVVRSIVELAPDTQLFNAFGQTSSTQLALAPDGREIVFAAMAPGHPDTRMLYRRRLDRLTADPIAGSRGAEQPVYSPDGRWIAFFADGHLRRLPSGGGAPQDLAAWPGSNMGTMWADDGRIYVGGEEGIRAVPEAGGVAETVTRIDAARDVAHTTPYLLPSTRTLLFTSMPDCCSSRARVEAMTLPGGARKVLLEDAADARYLPSDRLLFMRRGTLTIVAFDPSRAVLVGPATTVLEGVGQALNVSLSGLHSGAGQYAVTPGGTLAYAIGRWDYRVPSELVWVTLDGRTEPVGGVAVPFPFGENRVSPDGLTIAFVQQRGPLWMFDLRRSVATRLTPMEGLASTPSWRPDGRSLTVQWSPAGSWRSWTIATDQSDRLEPFVLDASDPGAVPASWSADGRHLAYLDGALSKGVLVRDVETGKNVPYPRGSTQELYPEFSPDGRWIAYASYGADEGAPPEVRIRSFPDGQRTLVVSNGGGTAPCWSRDGRHIYYVSALSPPSRMMQVDVDLAAGTLGRSRPLFDYSPYVWTFAIRAFDIHPDGTRFLCTRRGPPVATDIRRLTLVQNWSVELNDALKNAR